MRDPTSARWPPARGPASPRTQGRNARPSLRKKNVRTSVSTAVISAEVTALTPTRSPEAMLLALERSRSWAALVTESTWAWVRSNWLCWTHCCTCTRPSEALSAISSICDPTVGTMKRISSTTAPRAARTADTAASAGGKRHCRSSQRAAGSRTVARTSARMTGSRMLHSCCTIQPTKTAPTAITSHRSVHWASHVMPPPRIRSRDAGRCDVLGSR